MRRVVRPIVSAYAADPTNTAYAPNTTPTSNSAYTADSSDATNSPGAANTTNATYTANTPHTTDAANATDSTHTPHTTDAANAAHTSYPAGAATTDTRIPIEIVVDVYVDVTATPTAAPAPATGPKRSHRHSEAEGNRRHADAIVWGIVNRWIRIVKRRTPHYHGIVGRHIHHLRIGLFDDNHALALDDSRFHLLLFGRLQSAFVLGLLAHALHRIHNIALLRQEGVAQIDGPLNVVAQTLYHVRKGRHGLDARIPGLFLHRIRERLIFQTLVVVQPPLQQDDFERIRGCSQYLGQQWVWIKSNWRDERIQLVRRNLGSLAPGCWRRRWRLLSQGIARQENDATQNCQ